jgi:hypothetical protein
MTEEWNQNKTVCFSGESAGAKVTNPKTVLGSSPDDDGFRNNNFFL